MNLVFSFLTVTILSLHAYATEQRTFTKVGPEAATVKIVTEETDVPQAAAYVDAAENVQFIQMMMDDSQSSLAHIKNQMEFDNCGETSTDPEGWIPGCGRVEITPFIRTSFGRGGWMEAGADYTFFVGFRFSGSGHFFESKYMVTINEAVVADVNEQMEYLGSLTKSLNLEHIVALPLKQ